MRKVLALIERPDHVCYRYRLASYRDALSARGWSLEALPLDPRTFGRASQLRAAADADLVVLQRKLLPLWQLRVLRRLSRRLIYDFDDALFCRDSYARKGTTSVMRLAHFWATIYAADAVSAGNSHLAAEAATYIEPERVCLLPTAVNPCLYKMAQHERIGSSVSLAWIGQHSTLPYLHLAYPALRRAAEDLGHLGMIVICNRFPQLDGVNVIRRQWSSATEAEDLAGADIGISWLPDDPWSRGKCGLKVLQYMAAGLPVVANPVGVNREMVRHGESGFLVGSPDEAAAALVELANNPGLRRAMGACGRRIVANRYSVDLIGPKFAALVQRVWEDHPSRSRFDPASRPTSEFFEGAAS